MVPSKKFYIDCFMEMDSNSERLEPHQLLEKALSESLPAETYIWTNIQSDWVHVREWSPQYAPILKSFLESSTKEWSVKVGDLILDNLSADEVVETLIDPPLESVWIKESGQELFHPILDNLAFAHVIMAGRRKEKRYPVTGWAKIDHPEKNIQIFCKIRDIGVNGVGCFTTSAGLYKKSKPVSMEIQCDSINKKLAVKGIVLQSSKTNHSLVVQFDSLSNDNYELINSYLLNVEKRRS